MLYQGVIVGRLAGEQWQTGLYFRNTNLDLEGIRNTWGATTNELLTIAPAGQQSYLGLMNTDDNWFNAWAYQIDESTDRRVARTSSSDLVESGLSAGLDIQRRDCVLALFYTALHTRRIGRMYLPRVGAGNLTNGALSSPSQINVKACVTQMITYMQSQLCVPVIRSRKQHLDQPVSSWVVSNRLAARRSRMAVAPPSYL